MSFKHLSFYKPEPLTETYIKTLTNCGVDIKAYIKGHDDYTVKYEAYIHSMMKAENLTKDEAEAKTQQITEARDVAKAKNSASNICYHSDELKYNFSIVLSPQYQPTLKPLTQKFIDKDTKSTTSYARSKSYAGTTSRTKDY